MGRKRQKSLIRKVVVKVDGVDRTASRRVTVVALRIGLARPGIAAFAPRSHVAQKVRLVVLAEPDIVIRGRRAATHPVGATHLVCLGFAHRCLHLVEEADMDLFHVREERSAQRCGRVVKSVSLSLPMTSKIPRSTPHARNVKLPRQSWSRRCTAASGSSPTTCSAPSSHRMHRQSGRRTPMSRTTSVPL